MLAVMFMDGGHKWQFGYLMKDLAHDFSLGKEWYPASVDAALEVMTLHAEQTSKKGKRKDKNKEATKKSFAQEGKLAQRKCWKCGQVRHLKGECPELQKHPLETGETHVQEGWSG